MGVKDWLDGVGEASYLLSVGIFLYVYLCVCRGGGGMVVGIIICWHVCVCNSFLSTLLHTHRNYHYLDSKLYIFNVFIIALQCLMVKHMIDYF